MRRKKYAMRSMEGWKFVRCVGTGLRLGMTRLRWSLHGGVSVLDLSYNDEESFEYIEAGQLSMQTLIKWIFFTKQFNHHKLELEIILEKCRTTENIFCHFDFHIAIFKKNATNATVHFLMEYVFIDDYSEVTTCHNTHTLLVYASCQLTEQHGLN